MRAAPVVVVHAGAGARTAEMEARCDDYRSAVLTAVQRARVVLQRAGNAVDAVVAAVTFMEDEVEFFNAGRGSALCSDGSVEMSAALMRGSDRAAGAVAGITRTRHPILAAQAVLQGSQHVMLAGRAADEHAARAGAEQRDPGYFVTDRQRRRLAQEPSHFDHGTVGAVCLDARGTLAAATSTGGRRGQLPGRVGDSPLIGAGTWADEHAAISCTGHGEAFIRTGAAGRLAFLVAAGTSIDQAAELVLEDVASLGAEGGLIAVDARGEVTAPLAAPAMPRGMWRSGEEPTVTV